ncbi:MAG: DegT/DnrJ/EryC1/StrS family aminotransferase [Ghiorsea sp.]
MIHIPHSRPQFGQNFETAVTQVVKSGILALGDTVKALEIEIQNHFQDRKSLAVDSGTNALMLSIRAVTKNKVRPRIGIPSYACASLLFAVKAANATPVFLDCNQYLCLDKNAALDATKTLDALIIVHPFGMVDPIIKEAFSCPIIEDIAQSVGASLAGQPVGTFGDISIGSLYATKPWGGAYGGFITSQNQELIHDIRQMCDPDQADITLPYAGHHQLSNIHACLAYERLEKAAQALRQRKAWASKYDESLNASSASVIHSQVGTSGNHFRYIIQTKLDARHIISKFRHMGIDASRPVQQPLHQTDKDALCDGATRAWQHCVSLPLLADMNDIEFEYIQHGIQQCL